MQNKIDQQNAFFLSLSEGLEATVFPETTGKFPDSVSACMHGTWYVSLTHHIFNPFTHKRNLLQSNHGHLISIIQEKNISTLIYITTDSGREISIRQQITHYHIDKTIPHFHLITQADPIPPWLSQ